MNVRNWIRRSSECNQYGRRVAGVLGDGRSRYNGRAPCRQLHTISEVWLYNDTVKSKGWTREQNSGSIERAGRLSSWEGFVLPVWEKNQGHLKINVHSSKYKSINFVTIDVKIEYFKSGSMTLSISK